MRFRCPACGATDDQVPMVVTVRDGRPVLECPCADTPEVAKERTAAAAAR